MSPIVTVKGPDTVSLPKGVLVSNEILVSSSSEKLMGFEAQGSDVSHHGRSMHLELCHRGIVFPVLVTESIFLSLKQCSFLF